MSTQGSKWGASEFRLTNMNMTVADKSLDSAVKMLHAKTKQAFFGAIARNGIIKRRTWNGCAFNAGSMEQEILGNTVLDVHSVQDAALAFGESPAVIRRFIYAWDQSNYISDQEATQALREMLIQAGLFNDPDTPGIEKREKRIVVQSVFASTLTDEALMNELTEMVQNDNMNEELANLLNAAESLVLA